MEWIRCFEYFEKISRVNSNIIGLEKNCIVLFKSNFHLISYSLGGEWLITDMNRDKNMFEIDVGILADVESGIVLEGSNLSGVSCQLVWSDRFISRN